MSDWSAASSIVNCLRDEEKFYMPQTRIQKAVSLSIWAAILLQRWWWRRHLFHGTFTIERCN